LLLCSDGVDGVLSADEIIDCLHATPMLAAEGLCDAVLKKNKLGQDNLTAVVLEYQVEDLTPIAESARMVQGTGWQVKASGTGLLLLITYLLVTKYLA
jgi:protein phosphatase